MLLWCFYTLLICALSKNVKKSIFFLYCIKKTQKQVTYFCTKFGLRFSAVCFLSTFVDLVFFDNTFFVLQSDLVFFHYAEIDIFLDLEYFTKMFKIRVYFFSIKFGLSLFSLYWNWHFFGLRIFQREVQKERICLVSNVDLDFFPLVLNRSMTFLITEYLWELRGFDQYAVNMYWNWFYMY